MGLAARMSGSDRQTASELPAGLLAPAGDFTRKVPMLVHTRCTKTA